MTCFTDGDSERVGDMSQGPQVEAGFESKSSDSKSSTLAKCFIN